MQTLAPEDIAKLTQAVGEQAREVITSSVKGLKEEIQAEAKSRSDQTAKELKEALDKFENEMKSLRKPELDPSLRDNVDNSRPDQDNLDEKGARYLEAKNALEQLKLHEENAYRQKGSKGIGSPLDAKALVFGIASLFPDHNDACKYVNEALTGEAKGILEEHITKNWNNNFDNKKTDFTISKNLTTHYGNIKSNNVNSANQAQAGGIVIQPDYSSVMLMTSLESTPIAQDSSIVRISSDTYKQPILDSYPTASFVAEGNEPAQSIAGFMAKEFNPQGLASYVTISNKLIEASTYNIESIVVDALMKSIQRKIGWACVSGGGNGMPQGFNTDPNVARVQSSVTGSFNASDIIKLSTEIKSDYQDAGVYYMNRNTLGNVRALSDSNNRPLWAGTGAFGDLVNGRTVNDPGVLNSLNGRPVKASYIDLPNVSSGANSIYYADMKNFYLIVYLDALRMVRDIYTNAPADQIRIITYSYVDGGLLLNEAGVGLTCK